MQAILPSAHNGELTEKLHFCNVGLKTDSSRKMRVDQTLEVIGNENIGR